MGIRKVLGASVHEIMLLFVQEFIAIILIAACIACPVAYLIMHNWLNDYVYHISISFQPFVLAIIILCAGTLLLIGLQTAKAAVANPVKSLRTT